MVLEHDANSLACADIDAGIDDGGVTLTDLIDGMTTTG
jgi:hypothetical protein